MGIGVGLKEVISKTGTSIFARVPPEGCHGGDSLIRIDKKGIEGEGSFPADPLN